MIATRLHRFKLFTVFRHLHFSALAILWTDIEPLSIDRGLEGARGMRGETSYHEGLEDA